MGPAPPEPAGPDGVELETLEDRLNARFAALGETTDAEEARILAEEIRSIWRQLGGPTAEVLLARGLEAFERGDLDVAGRQYAHLRLIEPDLSEGWVRTAQIAAARGDWPFAIDALEEAVRLEPRRFDAYIMLGRAFEQAEENAAALAAYEAALAIHPLDPRTRAARDRVEQALEGRAL